MPKKQATKDAPKKKLSKDEVAAANTVEKVIKHFDAAWDYTSGSLHDRWNNNFKLYNNERVKRGYDGISDTFVPMVHSTVETFTSALFGYKPKFNYLPPHTKADQKTDILNATIDHYWDKGQYSVKVINTGRSMFTRGVGVDYFVWAGDHPKMINVPLRDFFIDPYSTDGEDARYMGRRYLTTLEELKSYEIVDLDAEPDKDGNYPLKKKYKNLDKLEEAENVNATPTGSTDKPTDKQEKDMLYGSTTKNDDDQVEVIEYWTEDEVISVMNRKVLIEQEENYYKAKARANGDDFPEGLMPFAWARDIVDESLFYAKGEVDVIADQQEDLNDISNQNKDAITYILNPMYTMDTNKTSLVPEDIENIPGGVYPGEDGFLTPIDQRPIPGDAFNERMNIKNEIREATASNEVMKGVGEAAGANATATEINAQIAGAGQRINLKITQIENEYFHRMARILFQMIRLYVTEPMMVRIIGKDGARWEEFDPSEYNEGNYEPRVQLDISIENQKAEEAANAKEMMAAFLNDPDVNQLELKKLVLAKGFKLDPDEVEVLMTPNPAMPDPMMGMGMGDMPIDPMAGMPVEGELMPPTPEEDLMLAAEAQLPPPQAEPEVIVDPMTGIPFILDPVTGEPVQVG